MQIRNVHLFCIWICTYLSLNKICIYLYILFYLPCSLFIQRTCSFWQGAIVEWSPLSDTQSVLTKTQFCFVSSSQVERNPKLQSYWRITKIQRKACGPQPTGRFCWLTGVDAVTARGAFDALWHDHHFPSQHQHEKHHLRYVLAEDLKTTWNMSSKKQCLTLSEWVLSDLIPVAQTSPRMLVKLASVYHVSPKLNPNWFAFRFRLRSFLWWLPFWSQLPWMSGLGVEKTCQIIAADGNSKREWKTPKHLHVSSSTHDIQYCLDFLFHLKCVPVGSAAVRPSEMALHDVAELSEPGPQPLCLAFGIRAPNAIDFFCHP